MKLLYTYSFELLCVGYAYENVKTLMSEKRFALCTPLSCHHSHNRNHLRYSPFQAMQQELLVYLYLRPLLYVNG
jgi:hypothetical protein